MELKGVSIRKKTIWKKFITVKRQKCRKYASMDSCKEPLSSASSLCTLMQKVLIIRGVVAAKRTSRHTKCHIMLRKYSKDVLWCVICPKCRPSPVWHTKNFRSTLCLHINSIQLWRSLPIIAHIPKIHSSESRYPHLCDWKKWLFREIDFFVGDCMMFVPWLNVVIV